MKWHLDPDVLNRLSPYHCVITPVAGDWPSKTGSIAPANRRSPAVDTWIQKAKTDDVMGKL